MNLSQDYILKIHSKSKKAKNKQKLVKLFWHLVATLPTQENSNLTRKVSPH